MGFWRFYFEIIRKLNMRVRSCVCLHKSFHVIKIRCEIFCLALLSRRTEGKGA